MYGGFSRCRRNKATQPASRNVVWMPFQKITLVQDTRSVPTKRAKVHRKSDGRKASGSRRSAPHRQRNAILHPDGERHDRPVRGSKYLLIRLDDQIVFEPPAAISVQSRCSNGELRCRLGLDFKIEVECDSCRIEAGPKIGRGSGQPQPQTASGHALGVALHAGSFIAASTALIVASTTTASRFNALISSEIFDWGPPVSSSDSSVPR